METPYTGRFAPSPTGPLHAGSLLTALASWHDARAYGGRWLVRIEDIDGPRCVPGATELILSQLQALGLHADGEVMLQSQRGEAYAQALDKLVQRGWAYPCACSRRDIEQALWQAGMPPERHAAAVYPGTCRGGLKGREGRAWRLDVARVLRELGQTSMVRWKDRRLGEQAQDVVAEVGDFVLRRADGLWAYQLTVVVDDAAQGVSDVVRGVDLLDNTARQIVLQKALGLPTPRHLHVPLVLGANGEKLSKQNGATALDLTDPGRCLREAAQVLAQAGWPIDPTRPLKVTPLAQHPEP
jgi:glutamyl-Q tRNA(Asp) synthetase